MAVLPIDPNYSRRCRRPPSFRACHSGLWKNFARGRLFGHPPQVKSFFVFETVRSLSREQQGDDYSASEDGNSK
jgi:hypothetical protein